MQLLPRLWDLSRQAKMPFMAYMCVNYETGSESVARRHPEWMIPGTTMFAPESGWTELLCQRLREFLSQFPVEWLAFDGFDYGGLEGEYPVKPAPYVETPFREIIGRAMPARAEEITPAERLKYKREIMARQFRAIRKAVKETSSGTQIGFNVPFWRADDPLWQDHPMVNESEMLWTESTTTRCDGLGAADPQARPAGDGDVLREAGSGWPVRPNHVEEVVCTRMRFLCLRLGQPA